MNKPAYGRLATGIFFLVLGVYLVTYVGAFKSNDERAYFSGMDSFVKRGEFTANQIYWDYTAVGMLTKQGDMVPNYEPAQMIAPIPLYLWGRGLGAAVQGTMFFNALVLAASAALLFLCFAELGYGRGVGLLGSLVYAFGTLAWPYSRTFFREPLVTLAYLLAFYALLRYRAPAPRRLLWPALAGFSLGLAIVTKLISVGVIPGLALLAWATEWRRPAEAGQSLWRTRVRMALAAAIPLVILLLLYQAYNWMTLSGVEAFGRNIVEYTTNPQLSQTVPMRMLRAFTGITISPYKGLFWYSPVLLLGLGAAYWFIRRHKWEGWAALLIVAAHLAGYSRYNYWSGGVAWGMRYLLPVIPFLVILAAPVWEMLTAKNQGNEAAQGDLKNLPAPLRLRFLVVGPWLLIALSVFIQVLGVSIDLTTWEVKWLLDNIPIWGGLGQAIEGLMLRPDQSPVLGHLRLLLGGQPLDFAWVQRRPQGAAAVVPSGLILSLALAAAGLAAFAAIWRKPERARSIAVAMTLAVIVGASGLVLIYRQGDSRYDTYGGDRFLKPMLADLAQAGRCQRQGLRTECQDVFIMPDPALTDYFLNYLSAPLPWYSLEPRPVDATLAERLTGRYGRVLLGRDRNAQTDDEEDRRGWERWLTDHGFKLDERRYEEWARLLRFSAAGTPAWRAQPGQALGEFTLTDAALSVEGVGDAASTAGDGAVRGGAVQLKSGDTLQVALTWRADRQPEANYTTFLQLLDAGSQVKAQVDRWPGDGLYPTAALQPGQTITDRVALPLVVPAGSYQLIAGLYRGDAAGAPRLAGPNGDHVVLATVNVGP